MSYSAISVQGIWKEYTIGGVSNREMTFREALLERIKSPIRFLRNGDVESIESQFWALKDVSFDVQQGEVVGVIGRNGAGKSTLLKILSRITAPTRGRIEIRGRVASLLEVGTGFHPELTGRENIRLNGSILGMTGIEISKKFDEIVAFSGVERFIDTPVKRYSSGMQVRLAFAVAAHLDPEILLVDEVLAVGDAEFQKKCLNKMSEIAGKGGRTVVFVSHNLTAVGSLCSQGILLNMGEVVQVGDVKDILVSYVQTSGALSEYERRILPKTDAALASAAVNYGLDPSTYEPELRLRMTIVARRSMTISIGIRAKDTMGAPVGYIPVGAFRRDEVIALNPGDNNVVLTVPARNLATGSYFFSIDIAVPDVEYLDRVEDCLCVDVDGIGGDGQSKSLAQGWGWGSVVIEPSRVAVVS